VVFSPRYDITAGGIEQLHPFDSTKYSRVAAGLVKAGMVRADGFSRPRQLPLGVLSRVQGPLWLAAMGYGARAMLATEVPLVMLPSWLVWWRVLEPMQLACAGTVCAVELALTRPEGWAVNLGGGFHHARRGYGHGFCVHNDLTLAALHALNGKDATGAAWCGRVLYLDLDVHQGDGFERDLGRDGRVAIVDAFHPGLFPGDDAAAACPAITERGATFHHRSGDDGARFLAWLRRCLPELIAEADPDLVLYNAGTDILEGDPLGGLDMPEAAVRERDAIVFRCCGVGSRGPAKSPAAASDDANDLFRRSGGRRRALAMALSGGYQDLTAGVVVRSLAAVDAELGLSDGP